MQVRINHNREKKSTNNWHFSHLVETSGKCEHHRTIEFLKIYLAVRKFFCCEIVSGWRIHFSHILLLSSSTYIFRDFLRELSILLLSPSFIDPSPCGSIKYLWANIARCDDSRTCNLELVQRHHHFTQSLLRLLSSATVVASESSISPRILHMSSSVFTMFLLFSGTRHEWALSICCLCWIRCLVPVPGSTTISYICRMPYACHIQ